MENNKIIRCWYRITETPFALSLKPIIFPVRTPLVYLKGILLTRSFTSLSMPSNATFARRGDITPPCGVPIFVSLRTFSSITPDLSQLFICRSNFPLKFRFSRSFLWFILSKHFFKSASRTYFLFFQIDRYICFIAS